MRSALIGGLLVALLAACDNNSAIIMPPPGSVVMPSIGVGVSGGANITRNAASEVTVTVFRLSGAATAIDLSVEGLPAGVTAVFAPASVPATSTTSTLTLSASASATLGTVVAVVRAKTTGAVDATTQLVVGVAP
ncbi:MAG TPA: hypothetical protein VGP87_04730 [Gemmatimonadales bacterium]|nr:hypothetical protein [Gemmatimonadales bacterium]